MVADVIKQLIHKKFIVPMKWDDEKTRKKQTGILKKQYYDSKLKIKCDGCN